ncbi:MAG: transcription termination factor NusA [Verrucomicrobiia bacterium]
MKTEIFDMLDYWEKEKKIPRPTLTEALKKAFLAAGKKAVQRGRKLEVIINEQEKEIKLFATLVVVNRVQNAHDEISLEEARRYNKDVKLSDEIRIEVTPKDLGRIASTIATEAFKRALRQAEKEKIIEQYRHLIGGIVSGKVIGFEQWDVLIDFGDCEGVMPQNERVRSENFSVNDNIRGLLKSIENRQSGPRLIISRADPEFVKALFGLEVSEIKEGIIEIKAIARDPGRRTKVAVYSNNPRVDPVGACVGLRGDRVKNVVKELGNEKVDIVHWDSNIEKFIANAILPAKVKSVEVDKNQRKALVVVSRDQYQIAFGKHGQNARLISRLCGYDVAIIAEAEPEIHVDFEEKMAEAIKELSSLPGITTELAKTLVENGVTNLESLLGMEVDDLASIDSVGNKAAEILAAARQEAEKRKITLT